MTTMHRSNYPLAAIVGQEELKLSLMLNAVNPAVGGVLIRGEKGTAKSTAVRALADLLPGIRVVAGCPFSCSPDDGGERCDLCRRAGSQLEAAQRRVRLVELPLNATEDRVAGGIDFSLALKQGRRALSPGLLADAHRGILYVDEVNLLDEHIVDIVLDAAASGENRVEREGVSFCHPSRFILIGTMNPEEGDLRPQLLDRFGLCVAVAGAREPEDRVLLMRRREAFDRDRAAFLLQFEEESGRLARRIARGRERLAGVRLPRHLRRFISGLCVESHVAGHRADLVLEQAARALAALEDRAEVGVDQIRRVAPMVLLHRRRDAQPPPPPEPPENPPAQPGPPPDDGTGRQDPPPPAKGPSDAPEPGAQPPPAPQEDPSEARPESRNRDDRVFDIGATFAVKRFSAVKDRTFRRGSGRRSRTRVAQKQGRYVRSTPLRRNGDIALDATLRAAAPHQRRRRAGGNGNRMAVCLRDSDIREKIRERRTGNFLLFVVDASGSMGARGRMAASKGAVMSLLLDAYRKRDRVGLISFRRDEARVNLPPTASVELAGRLLAEMPVGGRTPLSAGLAKSHEQVGSLLRKDPTARPIVILITDGRSNVSLGDGNPMSEALRLATAMGTDGRVKYIVVDTEEAGPVRFGLAGRLAAAMGADYCKIDDLKAEALVDLVKGKQA